MSDISKIKTKSLRTQVYAALKDKLMQGSWKEGDKLPSEQEFCTMFGVSKVTIRAALQQLEILGLVETRHGEGSYVKKFSVSRNMDTLHPFMQINRNHDLFTVMEYRKIIEKGTIGLAVEKINDDDFSALEETYAIMTDKNATDEEFIRADFAFHYQLALISQNSMIIKVHELLHEILFTSMTEIVHLAGRTGPFFHRKLIDSLRKGNKMECEAIMEEHIEKNIEVIQKKMVEKK